MTLWFSDLFQNTREVYGCEPAECEEEDLLDILVILKVPKHFDYSHVSYTQRDKNI